MIEVRDLTKSYGPHRAISQLNFSVKKGEVVGFLGPNGAGKSTTMKIITGFMAPTSGEVRVAGFDVFEDPIEVKKRIGYLPETPPLYGDMTVESYLRFVANLKGVEKSKVSSYVESAIAKTSLGDVRKRLIQNLSKGFKQRVGISQALVSNPEVLILDEPTVGLDPRQVGEIRQLIVELAGQHTIILSTHILPEVQATCQRIIIINKGKIVAEDTLDGITRRMQGSQRLYMKVRRSSDELISSIKKISGVEGVTLQSVLQAPTQGSASKLSLLEINTSGLEDTQEQLASYVVSAGAGLMEMRAESLNLEDVFLKLTSREEQQGV